MAMFRRDKDGKITLLGNPQIKDVTFIETPTEFEIIVKGNGEIIVPKGTTVEEARAIVEKLKKK